jgi:hypothetical protein
VLSEFLPHPSAAPDRGSNPELGEASVSSGGRAAARPAARPVLGGWGTYATLIAFGVGVCLTGYFALGELDDAANLSRALNSTSTAAAVPGTAAPSRPPLPSLAVDDTARSDPADANDAQLSSAATVPADKRPVRESKKEIQPLPAFDPSYTIAEPIAPPPSAAEAVVVPPPVVAEPEPAAPDRWQLLASATSRCEREGLIAGLLCKERARLQYCEGYWGTVPQCTASAASSNTR